MAITYNPDILTIPDNIYRLEDFIEYQYHKNPEAHCLSIYEKGKWINYKRKDFWQKVEYYAELFSGHIEQSKNSENIVLFIKKLDFDLLTAYIGAIKSGHIPAMIAPISNKTSENEYSKKIEHITKITKAKYLFTDSNDFSIDDITIFTPDTKSQYSEKNNNVPSNKVIIQFSSGSTGLQKGIYISHQSVINHTKSYIKALNISKDEKIISWLPLYHDMGLIACYLFPLITGIPFFQLDPFDWIINPDVLLRTIEEEKITMCLMPNFAYHVLINKGKNHDLSSMKYFINCSEPIQADISAKFINRFSSVNPKFMINCYALAENTFAVSVTSPEKKSQIKINDKNIISSGEILSGTLVKIFNPDSDGIGEIGIKGDYLFSGFTDKSLPLTDGYYLTGDIGCLDNNELFILGRKKDILIINGKNIYPQDIENTLSDTKGVYPGRVVSFGIFNETIGSEELFVIIETDKSVELNQLKLSIQKLINNEVGIMAKRIEVVEKGHLVKTSSGKISRTRNRELYLNGEFNLL